MDFKAFKAKHPFLRQFTKCCIVGGTAAAINFSIYLSFTEWLNVWYIYSAIFGFIISAIFNFSTNKFWTFRNKEKGKQIFNQAIKFAIVMISGLIINTTIIFVLTEMANIDYRLSWVFATGTVTFWSFGFNRLWTFKDRRPSAELLLD